VALGEPAYPIAITKKVFFLYIFYFIFHLQVLGRGCHLLLTLPWDVHSWHYNKNWKEKILIHPSFCALLDSTHNCVIRCTCSTLFAEFFILFFVLHVLLSHTNFKPNTFQRKNENTCHHHSFFYVEYSAIFIDPKNTIRLVLKLCNRTMHQTELVTTK
jgi:hypothetical protein